MLEKIVGKIPLRKIFSINIVCLLAFSMLPAMIGQSLQHTNPPEPLSEPPVILAPIAGDVWNGARTIVWSGAKDIEDKWAIYCDSDGIAPYDYILHSGLYESQYYNPWTYEWNTPTVPNGYWYIVVLEVGIFSWGAVPGVSGQFQVDNSASPNIRINSNSDFNSAHGVSGGTGSEQDPWIIKNWIIDGTGFGYCIYIGNTTEHFIVQNCTLFDANDGINNPWYSNSGVILFNVRNGRLINNDITGNYYGIYLNSSYNTLLTLNNIYSQKNCGLYISYSEDNMILSNTITTNPQGINIAYSKHNNITANTVSNSQNGVFLSSAMNISLYDNIFINCGIFINGNILSYWNSHTINNFNTVNGKPLYYLSNTLSGAVPIDAGGAILANCSDIVIENQDLCFGTIGIEIGFSSNISITNVSTSSNYIGTGIYYSDNITLINVSALMNVNCGLILDTVNRSEGTHIMANSNLEYGLLLNKCNYNNINNCTFNNNKNGIVCTYSANITFLDNTAKSNQNSGIYIARSKFNTIVNSTTSGNNVNINAQYSDNNKFLKNNVSNTGNTGMYIYYSKNNVISKNIAIGNSRDGIKLTYWSYNNTVTDNYVKSNSAGIYLDYAQKTIVRNNTAISNGGAGLYLFLSKDNEIIHNNITHNNRGIQIGSSASAYQQTNVITYNSIRNNSYGIQSEYSCKNTISNNLFVNNSNGIYLIASDHNQIINNSVSHIGSGYGIRLFYTCDYNYIVSNTVSNYWYGAVLMNTCHNNVLSDNSVKDNDGGGIWIIDNSQYNRVFHNNIVNNINQAKDDCINNQWDNGYPSGGNYWSDYNGTDSFSGPSQNQPGSDGIGDLPYNSTTGEGILGSAGAQDNYPLMHPCGYVDDQPPIAMNESPPDGRFSANLTALISVDVTDESNIDTGTIRLYVNGFMVFYDLEPIPGGYTVSYWHEGGFQEGENVTCRIVALDVHGNRLDFTWTFTAMNLPSFTISLRPGWNLVSIPLELADTSVESVLSSISGKYSAVKHCIPRDVHDPWKSYRQNGTANDLAEIDHRMGFWVHAIENCTLTVAGIVSERTEITLCAGWNLVGYPSLIERNLANALWGTGADRVEVCDPNSPTLLTVVGPDYVLSPGQGFWVRVQADSVWVVDW